MVKRIKKRVPKETPAQPDATEAEGAEVALASADDDEFVQYTAKVIEWLLRYRVALLAMVAAGLVLAAAAAGIMYKMRSDRESASDLFETAADKYHEVLVPPAPAEGADGAKEAVVKTDNERRLELEAARVAFEDVRKVHGDRQIAALATVGLAGTEVDLGRSEKAMPLYDEVLAGETLDPFTRSVVLQAKAAALENANKPAEALKAWREVESIDPHAYGLLAGTQIGRLLELTGKNAEALAHYEKVQKDHADALAEIGNRALKGEIEYRAARLGSGT